MLEKLLPKGRVLVAFWTLIAVQLTLVVCHIGAIILDATAPSDVTEIVRSFFELSKEGNAPTWFASFLFTLIAFACGAIYMVGVHATSSPTVDPMRPLWLMFAALFLFLSFDETSQLHERLDWLMSGLAEGGQSHALPESQDADQLPFYKYLLIYIPVLAVLGLAMAWFVISRFRDSKTALMFLMGMGLLSMKLAVESVEQWSLSTTWFDHSIYLETVIIEMSCLFTGATIVFTSLLFHLSKLCREDRLHEVTPANASSRQDQQDSRLGAKATM